MTRNTVDKSNFMLEGPILPSIIKYTIPIILTSWLQLLFNAADLVIVGRYCGSIYVASVGATGAVTNLIVNLFVGLSVGAGVAVAHGVGCGNNETIHRTVHTAVPASLISGVFLTIIGISFSEFFLTLMGTPENVLQYSALYMRIYFSGITFTMLYNFSASILRAVGDTKSPLIFLSISGVINVILNIIFVTGFKMNVDGVAYATVVSQAISAVLVLIRLIKRSDSCKFDFKKMHFYKDELLRMIKIGLPAGIQSSLFSISNVLIQSSVNSFGDVFMSGSSASSNIEGFLYVCLNAFQHTSVNFIGQNTGARQYKRVKKILILCLICVSVVGILFGIIMYSFGETLLSIYIIDSPQAIEYGMVRMAFIALPYFLCGLMEVVTGALRGLGSSMAPMLISILGVCGLRLVWIFTVFSVPQFHTPECLFASYPVSWIITFIIELLVFILLYNKAKVCSLD